MAMPGPVAAGVAGERVAVGRDLGDGGAFLVADPGVVVRVDGEGDGKNQEGGGVSGRSRERLAGAGEKGQVELP